MSAELGSGDVAAIERRLEERLEEKFAAFALEMRGHIARIAEESKAGHLENLKSNDYVVRELRETRKRLEHLDGLTTAVSTLQNAVKALQGVTRERTREVSKMRKGRRRNER